MGSVPRLTQEEVDTIDEVYEDKVRRQKTWERAIESSLKTYRRRLLDCPWLWGDNGMTRLDTCTAMMCGIYWMCEDIRRVMDTMILQDRRRMQIRSANI